MVFVSLADQIFKDFEKARIEYEFWEHALLEHGFCAENVITAAQYYGKMCALAQTYFKITGDLSLADKVNAMDIKLYKHDFEGD